MADGNSNSGGMPFGGGIAVLIALLAGYFVVSPPALDKSRPDVSKEIIEQIHDGEDVQARLWQDPFAAVAAERKKLPLDKHEGENGAGNQGSQPIKNSLNSETNCAGDQDYQTTKENPNCNKTTSPIPNHSFENLAIQMHFRWLEHYKEMFPDYVRLLQNLECDVCLKLAKALEDDRGCNLNDIDQQTAPEDHEKIICSLLIKKRDDEGVRKSINDTGITLLIAMIPGGPYAENVESRMRRRYAVISGLFSSGYTPVDAEHIGFIDNANNSAGEVNFSLPNIIPYEWFENNENNSQPALLLWLDSDAFDNKPVLRFQRLIERIGEVDKHNLIKSIKIIGPTSSDTLKTMLINLNEKMRYKSYDLTMKKKYRVEMFIPTATASAKFLFGYDKNQSQQDVSISNSDLEKEIEEKFAKIGVSARRPTATDNKLVTLLFEELNRRGVKYNCEEKGGRGGFPEIALVSEWDTLYGRVLPDAFEEYLIDTNRCSGGVKHIHRYAYMRGIDGKLPGENGENKKKSDNESEKEVSIEAPVGKSQTDYLRRIAARLSETDRKLREQRQEGIKAIGILGSDVFDKLLVIRALRELFPKAIFFTTDLDANLLHPESLNWTRNMIIASSFDLHLENELQKNIPPFRSTYQTAIYNSVLLAMGNSGIPSGSIEPRLFEVGRNGAFDLTEFDDKQNALSDDTGGHIKNVRLVQTFYWLGLALALLVFVVWYNKWRLLTGEPNARNSDVKDRFFNIMASPLTVAGSLSFIISLYGLIQRPEIFLVVFLLQVIATLFALLVIIARNWKSMIVENLDRVLPQLLLPIFFVWAFPLFAYALPILPSLFITFIAQVVMLYLLAKLIYESGRTRCVRNINGEASCKCNNSQYVCSEREAPYSSCPSYPPILLASGLKLKIFIIVFFLLVPIGLAVGISYGSEPFSLQDGISIWPTEILRWVAICISMILLYRGWRFICWNSHEEIPRELDFPNDSDTKDSSENSILHIWRTYIVNGDGWNRVWRILPIWLPYLALSFVVIIYDKPFVPYRGGFAAYIDIGIIFIAVLFYTFMVIAIVDATVLCRNFINQLIRIDTIWPFMNSRPASSVQDICKREWNEIKLIAKRTEVISSLVYYPIIVALILIASRSTYFDNWSTPLGLAFVMALNIFLVICCAILLRKRAIEAKATALDKLNQQEEQLLERRYRPSDELFELINEYRQKIVAIKTGAFLPIPEQPWVRAISLLFGGGGTLVLIEMLSLVK